MMGSQKVEQLYTDGKVKIKNELKTYIYDVVAIIIIIGIVASSLNIFGLVDTTVLEFKDYVISWIPYFITALLLNSDFYKKGSFIGKKSEKYIGISTEYSKIVSLLNGEQLENLEPFCKEYNEKALINMQTEILRPASISFEKFNSSFIFKDKEHKPLKICNKASLLADGYTKEQINIIKKAKNAKIKGINSNILLSSISANDPTNIGLDEVELTKKSTTLSTLSFIVSTLFMSLIAVKDIQEWGWSGLLVVVVKIVPVISKSLMSYFKGYNDIVTNLCSHIARKTDILKIFLRHQIKKIENIT